MPLSWDFMIKIIKKLAGPPVYYTEPSQAPQIRMAGQYL